MSKLIISGLEAKEKLLKGIFILKDAVGSTLGPLSYNVALDRKFGPPNVVHDGVSVAKEIELEDPFENMGVKLVKEAANETNDVTGDGTTTSTVLAYHLIDEGLKEIKAGANPMKLRAEMNLAAKYLSEKLLENSKQIDTAKGEEVKNIARISAQDEQIGDLVAEAYTKLGKEAVITVEEGKGSELSIEYKEGMEIDKGWASPYFCKGPNDLEAEVEFPYILITDQKISSVNDLVTFLEAVLKVSKNLVIIADDIEEVALSGFVINKMRGTFNLLVIKAPGFGEQKKAILEDLAVLTGATIVSEEKQMKLSEITLDMCGQADKVWADKDTTRIIGGKGTGIAERVELIKKQFKTTEDKFEKERLMQRMARLSSGLAIINIGAKTEMELNEKKERAIDAVASTKAALEEGILPGGATALIHLSKGLIGPFPGYSVVRQAVKEPFMLLMSNSGLIWEDLERKEFKFGEGIDVMDGKIKDMVQAGIIDPTKVVRSALLNAISVAGEVLTTNTLVTDKSEEEKEPVI